MRDDRFNGMINALLSHFKTSRKALSVKLGSSPRNLARWTSESPPPRAAQLVMVERLYQIDPAAGDIAAKALHVPSMRDPATVPPSPAPALPAPGESELAAELFAIADEFDLTPRALRGAVTRLLALAAQRSWSLPQMSAAIEQLGARTAAPRSNQVSK